MTTINTYAVVKNGTVINTILWDGDTEQWAEPSGTTAVLVSDGVSVGPGYTYADGVFTAPVVQQ